MKTDTIWLLAAILFAPVIGQIALALLGLMVLIGQRARSALGFPGPELAAVDRIGCAWDIRNNRKSAVRVGRKKHHTYLESDGRQIVPQSMTHWLDVVIPLSDVEKREIISAVLAFLNREGIKPVVILIKDDEHFAFWKSVLPEFSDQIAEIQEFSEAGYRRAEYQRSTSHEPFGRALIEEVARRLKAGDEISYGHRDYCGHGLFYDEGRFILARVNDGDPDLLIAEWPDEESLIAFFARQSDFTCSGADPNSSVFSSDDTWAMGNQTISRERLEHGFSRVARSEGLAI